MPPCYFWASLYPLFYFTSISEDNLCSITTTREHWQACTSSDTMYFLFNVSWFCKPYVSFRRKGLYIYLQRGWWVNVVTTGVHQVFFIQRGSFIRRHLKGQMKKCFPQCFHPLDPFPLPLIMWVWERECLLSFCVCLCVCLNRWRLFKNNLWEVRTRFSSNIHQEGSGLSGSPSLMHFNRTCWSCPFTNIPLLLLYTNT